MQIAAFLSDLKSLSVCPHEAALDLVHVHKKIRQSQQLGDVETVKEDLVKAGDKDLQRVEELMVLHQNVKVKYTESGPDPKLKEARQAVARILAALDRDV